jgi:alkylation response protein AidB-like acyl-CoA dehydrogenase
MAGAVPGTVAQVREQFGAWLHEHEEELQELCAPGKDVTATFTAQKELQRLLYESGWIRLGWSEAVGGLGGERILRAVVVEELCSAGYPPPFSFGTQEVLGPAVAGFAPRELGLELEARLLRGDQ